MLENLKARPLALAAALVALLCAVGVLTFAGPCIHDDGTASACGTAGTAIAVASCAALVVSAIALFVKNRTAAGVCCVVAAIAGAFVALAPGSVLPLCMMRTMRCWAVMRPFALVCGIAIALLACVQAFFFLRAQKR